VQDIIKEDAKRALNARMSEWNARGRLLRRNAPPKTYRIAQGDWWIDFFADTEGAVPPCDVEIHSELNDVARPGYRGAQTTLLDRTPSITSVRVARDREHTRRAPEKVLAEIRYQDDSGSQTFAVTQNEGFRSGAGGEDIWVDLPLYTTDEVSRGARARASRCGDGRVQDYRHEPEWDVAERPALDEESGSRAAGAGGDRVGGSGQAVFRSASCLKSL